MYSVIIIDDEPWAIRGIRNAFSWQSHGFEIAGQFTSARQAFDYICTEQPDLVFTDIRMPEYTGLDLIRMTREKGIDTEFVIVSGFAEFSYAQEALRYGALDYCLKPVDMEMAGQLIAKLEAHFSSRKNQRNSQLLEAVMGADKSELRRMTRFFDDTENCFFRAVISCSGEGSNTARAGLHVCSHNMIEMQAGPGKMIYIMKSPHRAALEGELFAMISATPGIRRAGVSSMTEQAESIPRMVKEADIAAAGDFTSEEPGVRVFEQQIALLKPSMDKLGDQIRGGNAGGLTDIGAEMTVLFRDHQLGMNEAVYLWNTMVSLLMGSFYSELADMELEYLNYSELRERFKNLESMCAFFSDVSGFIRQKNRKNLQDGDALSCFMQMVRHIDQHYAEELYLRDLSVKFLLNQVSCCQLFKKQIGRTFSEYVTDLRVRKASELLKTTDMSIEDIAQKVGYVDYYYFNKVFKKQCGITPARFRKG